jgi:NitT/TauT family transport system ATP-binding protein
MISLPNASASIEPIAARDGLLVAEQVSRTYQMPDRHPRLVLDRIDLALREGEIVALLGKSGSGKSTFLRLLSGLLPPSAGKVLYRGAPVTGPALGIAMVFQSFALFPWLTVLGNVELGLEALGVPAKERRERALDAINLIGLDGFESAYPKELSGGMRQRVGFARALVVRPDILLLDEPFSALDVLTAETLRADLLHLWLERRIPTRAILLVSHNIEEAIELADRVVIFGSDPGQIRADIPVALPRPRAHDTPGFRRLVDDVYAVLTTAPGRIARRGVKPEPVPVAHRLPDAPVQQFGRLIEVVSEPPYNGRADLPHLADELGLESDDLFPLLEAAQILDLAHVAGGDIELTPTGRRYADAEEADDRKRIFAEQLMTHVGLVAHIRRVLDDRPNHRAPASRFQRELEDHLSEEEAERVMETAITWARHAELFAYDADTETLSLDDPGEEAAAARRADELPAGDRPRSPPP